MNYFFVYLGFGGDVIREVHTHEIMNQQVGEFESREEAMEAVCEQLKCSSVVHGLFTKRDNAGGFLLCDAHEFVEL